MEHIEKEKPVVEETTKEEQQTPLSINRDTSRMFSGAPFAYRPQGHPTRAFKVPDHISKQYKD